MRFLDFLRGRKKDEAVQLSPLTAPAVRQAKALFPDQKKGMPLAYLYEDNELVMADQLVNNFSALSLGLFLDFVPEPDKQEDDKAVKVLAAGQHIGYVHRGLIQDMIHDFMGCGDAFAASINLIDETNKKIGYAIAFYTLGAEPGEDEIKEPEEKLLAKGRLTSNTGKDPQDAIGSALEGREVRVKHDPEKDRYEVYDIGFIGCLPKSLIKYADTAAFRILETGVAGSGKMYVVVGAYEQ